jgi:hypothetical protein
MLLLERFGDHVHALAHPAPRREGQLMNAIADEAAAIKTRGGRGSVKRARNMLFESSISAVKSSYNSRRHFSAPDGSPPEGLHDADLGLFATLFDDIKIVLVDQLDQLGEHLSICTKGHCDSILSLAPANIFGDEARLEGKHHRTFMQVLLDASDTNHNIKNIIIYLFDD